MDAASKFEGGAFVANAPNRNLGADHIGMQRNVYDVSMVLPETSMTEEQWTKFLRALVYVMPEETIDS
eukprot:5325846-Karenia_brevis.AAC.1